MNQEETNYVDISPISKGKRMLLFLADYFICLIAAIILMNAIIYPISRAITSSGSKADEAVSAETSRDNVLYGNNLLFYRDNEKYDYTKNLEYTCYRFISYYAFDEANPISSEPTYGHQEINEIINHYYIDIKNNKGMYINYINKNIDKYPYLETTYDGFKVKEENRSDLRFYFTSPEDMSENGEDVYNNVRLFFLNSYASVMSDIKENDLSYNGVSFMENQKIVDEFDHFYDSQISVCSFVAYVLSWFIIYMLIPLINKENHTPGQMAMRLQRVGMNNLYTLRKNEVIIHSIYHFFFALSALAFIPLSYISITYVLNMPFIAVLSIISLLMVIASFFIILFNHMNRSLFDIMSRSVNITNDDLDAIYRAKGYHV